jgi:hypothetical protein
MPREGTDEEGVDSASSIATRAYAAAWARPRICSFDLRRVCIGVFNDAPLLGDDPDDAIRSASATSASAISS